MKRTPQRTIFLGLFLAGPLSATAKGGTSHLPVPASEKTKTPPTKRRLDVSEDGFDLGEWAGDVWDSVTDSLGFGDDDNGNDDEGSADETPIAAADVGAWEEWLSSLLENAGDGNDLLGSFDFSLEDLLDGGDVCPLVEAAIGMGSGFGAEAGCSCEGDFGTGLDINCLFDACAPGDSGACGTVKLDARLGGPGRTIDLSACADLEGGEFKETCFSYSMDVDGEESGGLFDQTCAATYGGQDCGCSIENGLCLSIDCSAFVPGARMNSCQALAMVDAGDLENWIPDFEIFRPGFELRAVDVPWANLDLDNLDLDSFDLGAIQWGDDFPGSTWTDLLGGNPGFLEAGGLSEGTCRLMARAVDLSEELGAEGNCDCKHDETTGVLDLSCSFSRACTGENDNDNDIGLPPLCGSVDLTLTYARLAEVYVDVCIRYDDFPETCYSYGIPFAADPILVVPPPLVIDAPDNNNDDNENENENGAPVDVGVDLTPLPTMIRDCSAEYAGPGNDCRCTIDKNDCLVVDCTDFEPLAITDNCKVIGLNETSVSRMIPEFRTPGADDVVSDGAGGVFEAQTSNSSSSGSTIPTAPGKALGTALALGLALGLVGRPW